MRLSNGQVIGFDAETLLKVLGHLAAKDAVACRPAPLTERVYRRLAWERSIAAAIAEELVGSC